MFRPLCRFLVLPLTGAALIFTGCETIYTDVYSPKRNYYKPLPDRATAVVLPEETTTTVTPPAVTVPTPGLDATTPGTLPATPAAPSDPATIPGIPGLEPVPGAPMSPM